MLLLLAPLAPEAAGAWAAKQLAVSDGHSCALTKAGGVLCWGLNDQGQTGDGSGLPQPAPVPASGLESGVAAIAAAGAHACAVTDAGAALCWGYNQSGQLGDGTTTRRFVPTPVSGLASGVAAIATGIFHTCALTDAGGVTCWGRNTQGQLGNGTNTQSLAPVPVSGLSSGVTAIRAGMVSTCALTDAGGVLCWGSLPGNGAASSNVPVPVSGLSSGVSSIAAGYSHACARTSGGEVRCWGDNEFSQLGDHPGASSSVPVTVTGTGADVGLLTAGGNHTCFDGGTGVGVQCWGDTNFDPFNYDAGPHSPAPVTVHGLPADPVSLATGYEHACIATRQGTVWCWGSNVWGALGNGRTYLHVVPTPSEPTSGVTQVAAADDHTCAIWNGGAWCWGTNSWGELGFGYPDLPQTGSPGAVIGLASGVTDIATSREHSCAVAQGGALCWGSDGYGQLGDGGPVGFQTPFPVPVSGLGSGVADVATGFYHSCAALGGGDVWCWGSNESSQLGDGTTTDRAAPVAVVGLSDDVAAISAAAFFTCGLLQDTTVECWGSGWLGDGGQSTGGPVPVAGLSNVDAITAGQRHACALSQGVVSCWGRNNYGQLGDGSTVDRGLPAPVSSLPAGIVAIAAGDDHSCATTSGGETLCWGSNQWGQLGDGSLDSHQPLPTSVAGALGSATALDAGDRHTCGILADGSLHCWGDNERLQLGNGPLYLPTPGPVLGFEVPAIPALGPLPAWVLAGALVCAARRRPKR